MVVTVEITGMLEEILEALVAAGLYNNKSEVVRDAIRRLGENMDLTGIAFKVYVNNKEVTFTRILNVSGLAFKETIIHFIRHGYAPELGALSEDEVTVIPAFKGESVIDYSTLEVYLETGFIEHLPKLSGTIKFVLPKSLEDRIRQLPLRYGMTYKRLLKLPGFHIVKETVSTSEKGWLSESEAEALKIAANRDIPVVSCDIRFRKALRLKGIQAIPGLSLAYMSVKRNLVPPGFWPIFIARATSIPIYVPPAVERIV
ncbi:MAG: hypothetical protein F7B59_01545 [Desulfurococcales archaeon]|nr:hypothetical protein [Desulfurococcales archaeon]